MQSTRRAEIPALFTERACALLLCATSLVLSGCGEQTPQQPPDTALAGSTSGFRWAILPPEEGQIWFSDWGEPFLAKTPDVRAALSGVLGALRAEMAREDLPDYVDKKIWRRMLSEVLGQVPNYRCQIIGIEGSKGDESAEGRPFLYLNFLHEQDFRNDGSEEPDTSDDWQKQLILVDDGGAWFWQVKYNPADGTYRDLRINGEA